MCLKNITFKLLLNIFLMKYFQSFHLCLCSFSVNCQLSKTETIISPVLFSFFLICKRLLTCIVLCLKMLHKGWLFFLTLNKKDSSIIVQILSGNKLDTFGSYINSFRIQIHDIRSRKRNVS